MRFELRVENLEPETRNSKPGTIIMEHLLAVDVGGTKTDLALYDAGLGCRNPLWQETLPSQDYATFTELLHRFLDGKQVQLKGACLGVAGPVQGNRVKLTNLPWEIVGSEIEAEFGIDQVSIINDLVAIAHSIPFLSDDDLVVLKGGNVVSGGARGVVAPGTGLGIAFSVWDGSQYIVNPSEGGHAGFSPADEIELELLRFMFSRSEEPVSFESLCSGMGFPAIYRFLIEQGHFGEPYWLAAELAAGGDVTPVIVQAAMSQEKECPLCRETVRLFVQILAGACGNLAVTVMATGGIYLGGGMPTHILPFLQDEAFQRRFLKRGKMAGLLAGIPIFVIMNPKAALIGAAGYITTGP